jgi:hypothetical protein
LRRASRTSSSASGPQPFVLVASVCVAIMTAHFLFFVLYPELPLPRLIGSNTGRRLA